MRGFLSNDNFLYIFYTYLLLLFSMDHRQKVKKASAQKLEKLQASASCQNHYQECQYSVQDPSTR